MREILNDKELVKYLPPLNEETINSIIARTKKQWEEHSFGNCTIILKETDEIIGFAGLKYYPPAGPGVVDLGCFILKKFQNQGYATEVCSALLGHAFTFHKFKKVSGITDKKNLPVIKAAEKLGYKPAKTDITYEHDGIKFSGMVQFIIEAKK